MGLYLNMGFPHGSEGKEFACNVGDLGSIPALGRSPGGRHGSPLQSSCLENPHGHRSRMGYSPWGRKESDMTEQLSTAPNCGSLFLGWSPGRDCVSASVSQCVSIFCCQGTVYLVLRSFSGKDHPHVAVSLLCPLEEVSSGSSYATILNPSSQSNTFT